MKKILSLGTLALAGVLAFAGCSIKDEDGKAWAEENGYVKYEDTFTSSSVEGASEYSGSFEKEAALATAIGKSKGTYLQNTINPDGTINTAFYIFRLAKNSETNKWEIIHNIAANEDGTPTQTVANIIREGRGTAVYSSHGYNDVDATISYNAIPAGSNPTWEAGKFYKAGSYGTYSLVTSEPADWETSYASYFTQSITNSHVVDMKADSTSNEAVAAKMYYTLKECKETKVGDKVAFYTLTLEVQGFAPIA